jgi:hypothetical protein
MMRLVVGCPVYERAWILRDWFSAVADAVAYTKQVRDDITLEFAFAYTPSEDDTLDVIHEQAELLGAPVSVVTVTEGTHSKERNWGDHRRLWTLTDLRNVLLNRVAELAPDLYFSLDSDLLIASNVILGLVEDMYGRYDAVAPLTFLARSQSITNAFYYDRHVRRRVKVLNALQPADIICAAKMLPEHMVQDEQMRYVFHTAGEDIGFGDRGRELGYTFGIDTALKVKHIMEPEDMDKVDSRVGF